MIERYKDYPARTKKRIQEVLETLHKQHGETLPQAYWATLDLLADSYEIYFEALDSIKKKGVIANEKYKTKNPALPLISQQQLFITRLLNNLGCTPVSAAKMKKSNDSMPSDLDEFL